MKAMGGTELMEKRIWDIIPDGHKEGLSIVHGDPFRLKKKDINIFVAHDLPRDKGVNDYFRSGGNQYDKIVCVSDWQKNIFMSSGYNPDFLTVIRNFIEPIPLYRKTVYPNDEIRFIYTPTPHRGLQELFHAFDTLSEYDSNVHLDIYSSFKLYGQPQNDKHFKELFARIDKHPNMTQHGSRPNSEVRTALQQSHCFVYPSKWQETSCLCLIEAMSANLPCIHSSLAALAETSGGLTNSFDWSNDSDKQIMNTYVAMKNFVDQFRSDKFTHFYEPSLTKIRADVVYGPERARQSWVSLIDELKRIKHG